MSESGAFVVGGGGFQRVRDNASGGYAAELKREKQLAEDQLAKKQADSLRREMLRVEEEEKRRAANEAKAVQAFRDFHDGRGSVTENVLKYAEARGYYRENYKLANAELLNPEFIKVYYPERFAQHEHAKADAATLDHVTRCEQCGLVTNRGYLCGCFQVGRVFGTLTVQQVNGDSCTARCQCGREGVTTRRDLEDGITVCMRCEESGEEEKD